MKRVFPYPVRIKRTPASSAALAAAGFITSFATLLVPTAANAQQFNVNTGQHDVHILPTTSQMAGFAPTTPLPLTYHGGPVMLTATSYAIFWLPAKLQNGATTSLSPNYQGVLTSLLTLYPGHGIGNNNTQYNMTSTTLGRLSVDYIRNAGSFGGTYVETAPYPSSLCTASTSPNCMTDGQLQDEIKKVMIAKGWSGGPNNIFFLFTSKGETTCSGKHCAYTDYCGYHSYFSNGSTNVIYAHVPFAETSSCQVAGTPSPNNDGPADAAATVTSHELSEAITDPQLNAWYTDNPDPTKDQEIGDLCAWKYGANTWDSSKANQSWPESYMPITLGGGPFYNFELQLEWDNHTMSCVQVGP